MKKKKICSLLAVMAFAMPMMTLTTVLAEGNSAFTSNENVTSGVCKIGETYYSSLSDAISNAVTGATIEVTSDTSITGTIKIEAKTITITSGNAVTITTTRESGVVFSLTNNASLTISGGITLIGGKDESKNYRAVECDNSTFNLLTDNNNSPKITKFQHEHGGAIYASNSTINISGTVSENTSNNDGGAIYLKEASKLDIRKGATIENNSTTGWGGGAIVAFSDSQVEMSGGIARNNKAQQGGGFILVSNAKFTINGGEISNNTANMNTVGGAAIFVCWGASCEVAGGTITGNESAGGGAIAIENGTNSQNGITISGGTITGNTVNGSITATSNIYPGDGKINYTEGYIKELIEKQSTYAQLSFAAEKGENDQYTFKVYNKEGVAYDYEAIGLRLGMQIQGEEWSRIETFGIKGYGVEYGNGQSVEYLKENNNYKTTYTSNGLTVTEDTVTGKVTYNLRFIVKKDNFNKSYTAKPYVIIEGDKKIYLQERTISVKEAAQQYIDKKNELNLSDDIVNALTYLANFKPDNGGTN